MINKFANKCFIDEDKAKSGTMFTSIDSFKVVEEDGEVTKYQVDVGLVKAGHTFNNSWPLDKDNKEVALKGIQTMISMLEGLKTEIIKL